MNAVRVYLDVCCLCRPFDDQTQPCFSYGRSPADAMHIALAQKANAVFLTTGDILPGLIKRDFNNTLVCDNSVSG